jgi:hypothetical protein
MGSLPAKKISQLILNLKKFYNIETLVETGTYRGVTTAWAAEHFRSVITIDISLEYIKETQSSLASQTNIEYIHDDSRSALIACMSRISGNALFWLDAHKGGGYFGQDDDCPILEEILAIHKFENDYIILVDDARAFLFPPQPPFDHTKWPDIALVFDHLNLLGKRFIIIVEDIIISLPLKDKEVLISELHAIYDKFR